MNTLFSRAVDLLYPRVCANCARIGAAWCADCMAELAAYPFALGERDLDDGLHVIFIGLHTGLLRSAVHALKFEDARELAEPLGLALADGVTQARISSDLIVPVPLHAEREKWRGYNQSALLADTVAVRLGVPCERAVTRLRNTGTQVGRDAAGRHEAMQGAFSAGSALVQGRHILLIDDVVTTGSTLSACTEALYSAGAAEVVAACVASA